VTTSKGDRSRTPTPTLPRERGREREGDRGRIRRIWLAIGWLGIGLVVFLSLTPRLPELGIEQGDKLGHFAAYALLMHWFAQIYSSRGSRWPWAIGLVALGVALELIQRWTGLRTFSYSDMVADSLGVGIGWLLAPPRLPSLLALAERWLAR